jgi:hypothetical protein
MNERGHPGHAFGAGVPERERVAAGWVRMLGVSPVSTSVGTAAPRTARLRPGAPSRGPSQPAGRSSRRARKGGDGGGDSSKLARGPSLGARSSLWRPHNPYRGWYNTTAASRAGRPSGVRLAAPCHAACTVWAELRWPRAGPAAGSALGDGHEAHALGGDDGLLVGPGGQGYRVELQCEVFAEGRGRERPDVALGGGSDSRSNKKGSTACAAAEGDRRHAARAASGGPRAAPSSRAASRRPRATSCRSRCRRTIRAGAGSPATGRRNRRRGWRRSR